MRFFKSKTALLLTALGIRLWAGWHLGHFSHPQTWEPETIANHLLAGRGFLYDDHLGIAYRAYLLPAYPFLCAGVYWITHHSQRILLFLQCLLSAAACLQVYGIGRRTFQDPRIAWGGGWLTALHPGLIFYASLLHPLVLDLFSYLWVVWACLNLFQKPIVRNAIQLGLAAGLALLSRGTILPFFVLATGWFTWKTARLKGPRKALFLTAAILLTATAVTLPWLVRNARDFGRFPVFITSAGQSFWQGNNPQSIGTAHLPNGRPIIEQLPPDFQKRLAQTNELNQSDLFYQEASSFIRRNPASAAKLFLRKCVAFWWFSPSTGLYYPVSYTRGYRAIQLAILGSAFIGFWFLRRRLFSYPLVLLMGFLLSVTCFQSLYYVEGRHRWAVEPVLLLFSACGGLALFDRSTRSKESSVLQRTAQSYSVLWKQAHGRPLGQDSKSYHVEDIQQSLGLSEPTGRILDAGCGEGLDLANQGKRPDVKIVGVELSPGGCWASRQRIRHLPSAEVIQADLSSLPFEEGTFDFVYSYGVLHHMVSPRRGLKELIRVAKPGSWIAVYLYENFEDRNPVWRFLLGLGNLPRHVTTRLPHRLLYFLCHLASPIFFLLFTVPYRLSLRLRPFERWTHRMPFRHASNPWDLAGDLYDRFATPIEVRYSRTSAEAFFREAGLHQIRIANRRGWIVGGIKPLGAGK